MGVTSLILVFCIAVLMSLVVVLGVAMASGTSRPSFASFRTHQSWLAAFAAVACVAIFVASLYFQERNVNRQIGVKGPIINGMRIPSTSTAARVVVEKSIHAPSVPSPVKPSVGTDVSVQLSRSALSSRRTLEKPPAWIQDSASSVQAEADALTAVPGGNWSHAIDRKRFAVPHNSEGIAVSSGLFATEAEALEQLTARSLEIVSRITRDRWGNSIEIPLSAGILDNYVVADCQIERIMKDFGNQIREPMFRAHAWLNIDVRTSSKLYQLAVSIVQARRLWQLGVLAAGITICLGTFGQCLRWNIRTEGRYRYRLTAVSALIASTVVGGVWLVS